MAIDAQNAYVQAVRDPLLEEWWNRQPAPDSAESRIAWPMVDAVSKWAMVPDLEFDERIAQPLTTLCNELVNLRRFLREETAAIDVRALKLRPLDS